MAIERNINLIRNNKLFTSCEDIIFQHNLNSRNFTEYKEGDIIFQVGDTSNFIYLVISGEVKVKLRHINRVILKATTDFLGHDEIINDSNRSSSAVAMNDSLLYRIDKTTFKRMISSSDQINLNIEASSKLELKDSEEQRPKSDFPSMLKLDSSPIKLDIFKRKKKEDSLPPQPESRPPDKPSVTKELKDDLKDQIDKEKDLPELPDLDSVMEDPKLKKSADDSLKKELLGDIEDFENWNFTEVENPIDDQDEKIQFEEHIPSVDADELKKKLTEKHSIELNELSQKLTNKYTAYLDAIMKLLPAATLQQTCKQVVDIFSEYFDINFAALFLINEKNSNLELVYPESDKSAAITFDDGLTGKAAASKKIIVLRHPEKDLRFKKFDKPNGFEEGSVAYVPLNDHENKLTGVLQLAKTMKDFTKETEDSLSLMAKQAGNVIKFSMLNEDRLKHEKLSAFGSISKFLMQDIKSPILTIKHYSNLISRLDIPDQIKKVLTMLSMQANSVVDIMQSTFDFSENKNSVKLQKVSFNELMVNILELLSEYAESKNVKLFKKFDTDVNVNIDPRKFYVACFQVVKNACEAMPSGGKVYVNTEISEKNLVLKIRDEGNGIASEISDSIFKAFVSSGKENASGLGLSIAKHVIESMNGNISYNSQPNAGTTIIITLPSAEE